ncbi:MAG: glycosyltransferase [Anaerolineae bacterium]|nr:glycosyltransferase [Anaerolineae bacterium]
MLALIAASLLVTLIVIILAERHYRALPELPVMPVGAGFKPAPTITPSVEIIVPARNESAVIERVVRSLLALDYPAFHLTVADDASTDNTGYKAQRLGASVLCLSGDPPPGWTGKCHACDRAARQASADWLLFTDADTCHDPDSLRAAVAYAERHQLDALSLLLRQECGTLWERLVLPLAYQNFFSALRHDKPVFNGQYILIRRVVYEQSGGFGAVRNRVMEDVALANLLAERGYRIELVNGHLAASVRMYQNLPALWRGMTKTAFAAARDRGWEGLLLAGSLLLGINAVPLVGAGLIMRDPLLAAGGLAMIVLTALGLIPWLRRFAVQPSWFYALLNPLGVAILFGIGFTSTFCNITGRGVRWKGRTIVERQRKLTGEA